MLRRAFTLVWLNLKGFIAAINIFAHLKGFIAVGDRVCRTMLEEPFIMLGSALPSV
jgi:hypothetical protein